MNRAYHPISRRLSDRLGHDLSQGILRPHQLIPRAQEEVAYHSHFHELKNVESLVYHVLLGPSDLPRNPDPRAALARRRTLLHASARSPRPPPRRA